MKRIHDFEALASRYRANLINSIPGFKSVSLVGTVNGNGVENLAIFNSFFHIGANPPLLGMVFRPEGEVERHTLENIRRTGCYTINHLNKDIVVKAHHTGAKFPSVISEFKACVLTPWYSATHSAPYVKESTIRIGMKLQSEMPVAANNTLILIGAVTEIWLSEDFLSEDGFVDLALAGTLAGSNLDAYYEASRLVRLSYPKPDAIPSQI